MTRPIEVLLADDDAGDVVLTREALRGAKLALTLSVVPDGEQALKFLRREPPYRHAPRPDLVLLDLSMPRMDGREVLAAMKASAVLRDIPVCIVTTSDDARDVASVYGLGADCYVTKPIDLEQFMRVVQAIDSFWVTIVKLPPRAGRHGAPIKL
jgi:CheY-like chemotaxis protein